MRKESVPMFLLQLSFGIMFVLLGIAGLTGSSTYLSGMTSDFGSLFGGGNELLAQVLAAVELAAGVLLLLSLLGVIKENITRILLLLILIVWAVELVLGFLLGGNFLEPDVVGWLEKLAPNLVILASLWLLTQSKAGR